MKKNNLIIVLTPILFIILLVFGYLKFINLSDSIKFKREYENLNNDYFKVELKKDNNIKYSNYDEIFNILTKGTGIIYFGYPKCNDCRFAINTLFNVINEKKLDTTVYYRDIYSDRDSYVLYGDKLVYEKNSNNEDIKGTYDYFKLIDILDDNLEDYIIYVSDEMYNVGEKRIYFPTIVFVKEGKILYTLNVSLDIPYNELYSTYEDYISDMYSSTCEIGKALTNPC